MIFLNIKGKIVHIYEVVTRYSTINEFQYFQKQNIIIQSGTEFYTICFLDKKIELLGDCFIGLEVELEVKIKGRMWKYKGNINSVNELTCLKLKHILVENKVCEILYNDLNYNLIEYNYKETIMLKLVRAENNVEINLTAVCDFTNNSEKLNHILFPNCSNQDIFKLLHELKIIQHVYDIHQSGAASGYVCKLLYKKNDKLNQSQNIFEEKNHSFKEYEEYNHEIDFSQWNDDIDTDEQSEDFWNQF